VTGTDGRFTIANVPVGTQELEAVRTGYRPFRLPGVRIASPDTAHIYLALSVVPEAPATVEAVDAGGSPPGFEIAAGKIMVRSKTTTSVGEISENAPLYIIDGVILAPGTMVAGLDPKLIESVEVIKGAAAESLYGSRAANGVITITMRKIPD
jgi:TonB-dependent SusC/RagA subfamily outer membrane receptor